MKKIPNTKAAQLEKALQKCLDMVEEIEEQHGDECIMDENVARRINDILDSIGAFLIYSLE